MDSFTYRFEELDLEHANRDWSATGQFEVEYTIAARQPDVGFMSRGVSDWSVPGLIEARFTDVETGHVWPMSVHKTMPLFQLIIGLLASRIEEACLEHSTEGAM